MSAAPEEAKDANFDLWHEEYQKACVRADASSERVRKLAEAITTIGDGPTLARIHAEAVQQHKALEEKVAELLSHLPN
ncbi:hypothetical protein N7466_006812 [Penicillium verhagenii]|uniref:uncharacterized protein n=1 Tax=Penicillium verhagenii TaxID=1562060 RepID=UPI002544EBF2|nr:uncharacterized protein N7466_006812 [Penicillium verhagenii]KAJ5927856.1 hypothetical protein N7466_006812 [Penicillium verhagenii]